MLILTALCFSLLCTSQFSFQVINPASLKGACDTLVYDVFVLPDCEPAKCSLTDRQIEKRLNSEVSFLKDNPTIKDTGGVRMIINCKGEVINCQMDIKTQHDALNDQVKAVFNSLGQWKPATIKGKPVDAARYWTFTIKKGRIRFDGFNY